MAHHVNVLVDAGLVRVIRTRRVRAIDERFHGRAARDSGAAHETDRFRAILRHARIPRERAAEFWDRVFDLARDVSAMPREGETVYAFVAGLHPTDQTLAPDRKSVV